MDSFLQCVRRARLAILAYAVASVPAASPLRAQARAAASAQPIDIRGTDSASIAWLATNGRRVDGRHVVVWAPTDSLSDTHQRALVDSLDRGVTTLRALVGGPYAWQRERGGKVTYYLVPGSIISHAREAVFISVNRARTGQAPYLHETSHVLLMTRGPFIPDEWPDSTHVASAALRFPLWLSEGIADVLAQTAAPQSGVTEGDVLGVGGLQKADSTCASRLRASPYRAEIERVVGATGRVDALFSTDRSKVAPTFYACAQSMAKFVVDRIGLRRAISLFPHIPTDKWHAELERASGVPLATLQAEWRAHIARTAG